MHADFHRKVHLPLPLRLRMLYGTLVFHRQFTTGKCCSTEIEVTEKIYTMNNLRSIR